jgi:hypothetical protein
MDIHFIYSSPHDFDPEQYIKVLITIAKADRFNGSPEYDYVRCQAERVGVDFDHFWQTVKRDDPIKAIKVSRMTALLILKDCIYLASMDQNFSLPEKERIYSYAQMLDIPRTDVDILKEWLQRVRDLREKWEKLVSGHNYLNMFEDEKKHS